jgi:hypothetical protein
LEQAIVARNAVIHEMVYLVQHATLVTKWKALLSITCSLVTIRELKTLVLLAFNKEYARFFKKYNQDIITSPAALAKQFDPASVLMLWRVSKYLANFNNQNFPVKLIKGKFLYCITPTTFQVVELHLHFEEDGILWTEISILNSLVWDDSFTINVTEYKETVQISVNESRLSNLCYEKANKQRIDKMLQLIERLFTVRF